MTNTTTTTALRAALESERELLEARIQADKRDFPVLIQRLMESVSSNQKRHIEGFRIDTNGISFHLKCLQEVEARMDEYRDRLRVVEHLISLDEQSN